MNERERFIAQIHITNECNLRCEHCYQEYYSGSNMASYQFYNILSKIDQYRKKNGMTFQVNITGGEPLMHPMFFDFARCVIDRGIRLGILTNGTLIDDDTAAKIAILKPSFVQVSLDGNETIHDSIRGKGNFQKALACIDALKKRGVFVIISFTVQKKNHKCFKEIADICRRHKVDKLWWDRVVSDDPELYLSTDEFKAFVDEANELAESGVLFKKYKFISNQRSLQCIDGNSIYQCSAGKNLLAVLPNGDVMPCRRLPIVVGNLMDQPMEEIYHNETMVDLSKFTAPKECMNCSDCATCKGGAKCVTFAQKNTYHSKDVNCYK